jgi:hypothetical protein
MRRGLFRVSTLLLFATLLVSVVIFSVVLTGAPGAAKVVDDGARTVSVNPTYSGPDHIRADMIAEPGRLILLGLGMIALGAWRWKRT